MNNAKLATSARLKRTLRVLQNAKKPLTTMELAMRARIVAVSATVSELRENGADIHCACQRVDGVNRYFYTLIKSPEVRHA